VLILRLVSIRILRVVCFFECAKQREPLSFLNEKGMDVLVLDFIKRKEGGVINLKIILWYWVGGCLLLFVAGCSAGAPKFLAGNLNGVNHTSAAINHFSVNGYGGANISPFGYGGGMCCVMLPSQWEPGLKFEVKWEADPNPNVRLPALGTDEYRAAYAKHEANYQQHRAIVDLPPYEDRLCALEVHFLPCNEVKVSTSCWRYPSPNNPIKEPLKMQEPAACPR
jgi:hypothetical protein